MARITVEDCLRFVPDRFELVLLGAQRARDLAVSAEPTLSWDKDKRSVVALREFGTGKLDPADVREALIRSLQKHADQDSLPEEEEVPSPLGGIGVWAPTQSEGAASGA